MKKLKEIILLTALLAPFVCFSQENYILNGQIGKLDKPAKIYLRTAYGGEVHIDSTWMDKGRFEFKGTVPSPMEVHIRIIHDDKPFNPLNPAPQDIKGFLLEGATITFTSKDSIKNAVITGSPLNEEVDRLNALLKPIYKKLNDLNTEYLSKSLEEQQDKAYIQTLEDRAAAITKETIEARLDYIGKNPGSFISLMALNSLLNTDYDIKVLAQTYNALEEPVKQTELGCQAGAKLDQALKELAGIEAPDFTQPDVNGHPVKLSDYHGKYVLVDFWASWCAPCRRENPALVKTYEKYQGKGFEILGVSMDSEKDKAKWLKAIEDDGLTWKQVGDLKGWENEAALLYKVSMIPFNFLVDPEGKIIARDLRGDGLQEKLQELFGN